MRAELGNHLIRGVTREVITMFKNFLKTKWAMLLTIFAFAAFCKLSGHMDLLGYGLAFGTVASVPGYPDFTAATGTGKIPNLFSRKALIKFYDESVLPKNIGAR